MSQWQVDNVHGRFVKEKESQLLEIYVSHTIDLQSGNRTF